MTPSPTTSPLPHGANETLGPLRDTPPPFVLVVMTPVSGKGADHLGETMADLGSRLGHVVEGGTYAQPIPHVAAVGARMEPWRLDEFRVIAAELARKHDAVVTYSPPSRTTAGLRTYYGTARDSLETAVRFHRVGPRCIPLAALAFDRMILSMPRAEQQAFVKHVYGSALGPPAEKAALAVETVQAILLEGGTQAAPARALHLHRHGLAYRRATIAERAGRDPAAAESRPAFLVATRILDLGADWLPPLGDESWA